MILTIAGKIPCYILLAQEGARLMELESRFRRLARDFLELFSRRSGAGDLGMAKKDLPVLSLEKVKRAA